MTLHRRIDDIEILRAIAILLVVVHHASDNLFTWSSPLLEQFYIFFGGGSGVDLFFVISGFVITRSLYPHLRLQGSTTDFFRYSIKFWIKRAWRLLPSAWLWLLLTVIITLVFNKSGAFGSFKAGYESALAAFFQVANFRFADVFGVREPGASFVYWSLSLEEQFYLILPFLIFFSGKRLPYIVAVIALTQVFLDRNMLMIALRTDALCFGVLIALWSQTDNHRLFRPSFLKCHPLITLFFLSMFILGLSALSSKGIKLVDFKFGLMAILAGVLVYVASYNENIIQNACAPFTKILLWIGSRSYGIYLIHIPAFFLTREIWFRITQEQNQDSSFFWIYVITAGSLIIILSELNYRLVETPLRKKGAELANRSTAFEPPASQKNQPI